MATKKTTAAARPASKEATPVQAEAAEGAASKVAREKGPTLRIKSLVERVSEATGGKKKGVKEIVEATLAAIGDALAKGEELNLPGFGRTRIARTAEKGGASMMTLKIRRAAHRPKADGTDAKVALADDEDDS